MVPSTFSLLIVAAEFNSPSRTPKSVRFQKYVKTHVISLVDAYVNWNY